MLDFGELMGMNPNIIPHPSRGETWIIVAQRARAESSIRFEEMACAAAFKDGALRCISPPLSLPVAATSGDGCDGDLGYFNFNLGPHDARVFWGPDKPYMVYGSNSGFTCFGQFVQDFRMLFEGWEADMEFGAGPFRIGTELQRPLPWNKVEKNWFLFWDVTGQVYVHYDVAPKRVFARLEPDGSVGEDLAPLAAAADEACLAKYLPKLPSQQESLHQATNSLQITMCRRADASCKPDESNTFIFTVFQHKTYYKFHSEYEPYVMVFRQHAPFEMHAVSRRPLWIHGRQRHPDRETSDMFYVTSIAWKRAGQRYHGYLDDELFIGFGIEDNEAAAIDMVAAHLLEGLGPCNED